MTTIVVDGMGGGIGAELCSRIKELDTELVALGTNAAATERMIKAGARRGATGENAIRVTVPAADIIAGPIGIIIMNSMMGEITASMAEAILAAPGERVLLPLQNEHFYIAGMGRESLAQLIDQALEHIRGRIEDRRQNPRERIR